MISLRDLKVAFWGTPDFVVPVLDNLIKHNINIVLTVTQPDKPKKRSSVLLPSPVKEFCLNKNIRCKTPAKIDDEFIDYFKNQNIDLAIVAAYGQILPKEILDIPQFGFLNIHPSLLPKYRGASPLQAAILNNENETGVSIMLMDEKMDHGPILAQESIFINKNYNIRDLLNKSFLTGSALLVKILPDYLNGKIIPEPQDHDKATFTKLIKKNQGRIDWSKSAQDIHNQIRAYFGWPTSFTFWQGKKLEILESSIFSKNEKNKLLGEVWKSGDKILVRCGCGNLEIISLKLAGKRKMSSTDFVHGHKNFIGSILK